MNIKQIFAKPFRKLSRINLLISLITVFAIAVTMLLTFTATSYADKWAYYWDYDNWRDVRCDSSPINFKIEVFQHVNFGGQSFVICGHMHNLSDYQLYQSSSTYTWNNVISSLKIRYLPTDKCIEFYKGTNYNGGLADKYELEGEWASLPSGVNDTFTSFRRVDCSFP